MSGLVLPNNNKASTSSGGQSLNLPGVKSSQAADSTTTAGGDQQVKQSGTPAASGSVGEGTDSNAATAGGVVIPGVHGIVPTLQ